jgi:hypothetical protein
MVSAIIFHLARGETNRIVPNFALLALLLFVIYGRLALAPLA